MADNGSRESWDRRYAEGGMAPLDEVIPYPLFADHEDLFPNSGTVLEIACGRGRGAVWLARRGLNVTAFDISPVAIDLARQYADLCGVGERCVFAAHDLDSGLPLGEPVDVVLCHLFRDPSLDEALINRLRPGGLLAIACLSEVDAGPGRFRAAPGELESAFNSLDIVVSEEVDGHAYLIGVRR